MGTTRVKICGLSEPEHVAAAAEAGAAYIGLVFFPRSPRAVTPDQARDLALAVPPGLAKVALVVNPTDDEIEEITSKVPLDMIQLHGDETPERVAEIRAATGLPVMKALGVRTADDIARIDTYSEVADQILVDAKAPEDSDRPGGNGLAFDWRILAGHRWTKPWMLAGGLTPDTVSEAVALTGARQIDVSTGVEISPGKKDEHLIRAFLAATG